MNKQENSTLPISVVIPTFSEESNLPKLLKSLNQQVVGPSEIIVADAFSPDKTREIAKSFGCTVVDGGRIATGRNNGAKAAKFDYLVFIDADTTLSTDTTLLEAFAQFLKLECDIASAEYRAEKEGATPFGLAASTVVYSSWNAVRKIQSVTQKPFTEGGAFILVKKTVFDHIGGFDANIGVGEDSDFFRRAVKRGYKYANLSQVVNTSTRRYSDPKKASRSFMSSIMQGILLAAGVYAGSALFKKILEGYGRLGGGEGRSPNDPDKTTK